VRPTLISAEPRTRVVLPSVRVQPGMRARVTGACRPL
jgi:hypothetical protein